MMKSVSKLLRPNRNIMKNISLIRGNNEWDNDRNYLPSDEHVPPKQEEILREIFDRHYYHFSNKALNSDSHPKEDNFLKYRMWQNLYLAPKDAFLRSESGPLMKLLYFIFPGALIFYFIKGIPAKNKRKFSRRFLKKHLDVNRF